MKNTENTRYSCFSSVPMSDEREQSTSAVSNKSYEKFYKYLRRDSVEQPRASALHKGLFEKIFVSAKDTRLLTTIPNVSWLGEGGYFSFIIQISVSSMSTHLG